MQRYCPAFREDHAILVHNLLITDTVAVLLGHFPMKTGPHGQLSHPQYKLISTPDLFVSELARCTRHCASSNSDWVLVEKARVVERSRVLVDIDWESKLD